MLRKIGMITASTLLAISFSGCTESNIDKVKNSPFVINPFIKTNSDSTMDTVLSTWKDCKQDTIKWVETSKLAGVEVDAKFVEFTCKHKNNKDLIYINWSVDNNGIKLITLNNFEQR